LKIWKNHQRRTQPEGWTQIVEDDWRFAGLASALACLEYKLSLFPQEECFARA
jgi:hypothetical protein